MTDKKAPPPPPPPRPAPAPSRPVVRDDRKSQNYSEANNNTVGFSPAPPAPPRPPK